MHELIRANDPVLLSFAESLMKDAGIACFIADEGMSILEGSLGMLPRRLLIDPERAAQARRILVDAGLGHELREERP
ncbi:putative signal transducing protein [Oryzifoliimicrobium ureilyticus]|uniref:putative signal transducing protein n=1 Tax=Oryzifoliimicrobium ureilyticus TaxID=3113724 RepID=UPI003075FF49